MGMYPAGFRRPLRATSHIPKSHVHEIVRAQKKCPKAVSGEVSMCPCRLYIHLAFAYSIGSSSVVWSELRPAPPFPPMRVLEVQWSPALGLVCEVALQNALK